MSGTVQLTEQWRFSTGLQRKTQTLIVQCVSMDMVGSRRSRGRYTEQCCFSECISGFRCYFFFQLNPLTPLYFSTSLQVFSSICLCASQSRGWPCQTSLSNLIFQFQCRLPCTTKRWLEIQQFNLVDKSNVFYESPKAIN